MLFSLLLLGYFSLLYIPSMVSLVFSLVDSCQNSPLISLIVSFPITLARSYCQDVYRIHLDAKNLSHENWRNNLYNALDHGILLFLCEGSKNLVTARHAIVWMFHMYVYNYTPLSDNIYCFICVNLSTVCVKVHRLDYCVHVHVHVQWEMWDTSHMCTLVLHIPYKHSSIPSTVLHYSSSTPSRYSSYPHRRAILHPGTRGCLV